MQGVAAIKINLLGIKIYFNHCKLQIYHFYQSTLIINFSDRLFNPNFIIKHGRRFKPQKTLNLPPFFQILDCTYQQKHIKLQPLTVINFANENRKQLEQFTEAFRKRIVVEIDYADSLSLLSKSLEKYVQPKSEKAVSFICSAFQVQNQERAQQAKELASYMKTQIYEVCLNACRSSANLIKQAQKDVKTLTKKFDSLKSSLSASFDSYQQMSQQLEELVIAKSYTRQTSTIAQQKKDKVINKLLSSINDKKKLQTQYIKANQDYNSFIDHYNKSIVQTLNQLQSQIRSQVAQQADCIRKLIIAEFSMFKNIEYDLINISKQMQNLDTQKDVEITCQQAKQSRLNLIVDLKNSQSLSDSSKDKRKLDDSQQNNKLNPEILQLNNSNMAATIKNIESNILTQLIIHKKSHQFKQLIETRWKQLNQFSDETPSSVQIQSQAVSQICKLNEPKQKVKQVFENYFHNSTVYQCDITSKDKEEMQKTFNQCYSNFLIITRYIHEIWNGKKVTKIQKKKSKSNQIILESPLNFIKKILSFHHFYRLVSYSFIECFCRNNVVQIKSVEKVEQFFKFVNTLLTKSFRQNDVFVLRGLLFLVFTFYYIQNNSKLHMVMEPTIYKNTLWKKQDFWKAAIFQSTYQEMLSFGLSKDESIEETILKQKNLLFTQLASYSHYMIMLGINSKSVRQIVGRFCRLYETTEEQNKNLSKMITNTNKQYDQILVINGKENKLQKQ